MMMNNGTVAVALVKRQVMVVQAARTHTKNDKFLDVHTFSPFGERLFLETDVPDARIQPSDVLAILPSGVSLDCSQEAQGILELGPKAFSEYIALTSRQEKKRESLWKSWIAAH
ncbi:hypothetical protein BDN72DRAFT_886047 [Pluteus cervinus]|uniref:Uncharacterized protein n=1 Tax=Pluteus cervinus TaxID=181527 RepID=A0ACD3BBA3_9AGAR|nr:hypothetical protein BDN72DRAFT_886047 [Pluteus cervinus]